MTRFCFLCSLLLAIAAPKSAYAQTLASTGLSVTIPGYSNVDSDRVALTPGGTSAVLGSVRYETNQTLRTVYVHLDGDLTGLEVRVEPVASPEVLGLAFSGAPGVNQPVVFRSAGSQPLVLGITGAGVEMQVQYSVVVLDPTAADRRDTIQVSYSIN